MDPVLAANLKKVRMAIKSACARGSRDVNSIHLVVATKYVDVEKIEALIATDKNVIIGESRVQDAVRKIKVLLDNGCVAARTGGLQKKGEMSRLGMGKVHFIGHLQTNKIKAILPYIDMLHSLDRLSLAIALEKALASENRVLPVLLQINVSGEASKFGFSPDEALRVLPSLATFKSLRISGLMTMAPDFRSLSTPTLIASSSPKDAHLDASKSHVREHKPLEHKTLEHKTLEQKQAAVRTCFRTLRLLADTFRNRAQAEGYENIVMDELSMGMSQDFEIAIEEGATMVRLGGIVLK
ncbi:YggS family pyridoxal phosphate enzyme [Spirochaetota bacterium]|nr:YggS family pyridoxal phosphate enzyme [Spirochaetota bacterium]